MRVTCGELASMRSAHHGLSCMACGLDMRAPRLFKGVAMERTATYQESLNLQPNKLICRNVVLMPSDIKKDLWLFLDVGVAIR